MRALDDYVDLWRGETAYVVGSSAALDGFDPRWFDGKPTISINFVGPRFGLDPAALTVTQYCDLRPRLRELGWTGVVMEPDRRLPNSPASSSPAEPDAATVQIAYPDTVDPVPAERVTPYLVQGGTSLHPALHLAALMGASTIVTVAADHGWWNGRRNATVYSEHTGGATDTLIPKWHAETNLLAARLREWGIALHTMIPYINLNCEQDEFKGPRARIS